MAGNVRIAYHGNVIGIRPYKMEKTVKLWQFIISVIGVFVMLGTMIYNQGVAIENQRLRLESVESYTKDMQLQMRAANQETNARFKEISDKLTDIQVSLQNKQNRK